jgi:hypothetical protein
MLVLTAKDGIIQDILVFNRSGNGFIGTFSFGSRRKYHAAA